MNDSRFLSLFVVLAGILLHSPLLGQSLQYENQRIERIEVIIVNPEANPNLNASSITDRIRTKENSFFSQAEFDSDLKALAQDFDRIEPYLRSVDGDLILTLKVWAKPMIRMIHWRGNKRMKPRQLQKELDIQAGCIFDRLEFNRAFHKLKAYYVKNGFFEARLDYQVEVDPSTNEVDIFISIDEGRAGKIKEIVFCNFAKCEEDEILEGMLTKPYNFFLSWFTNEGTYNEDMMQQDQFVILNYLQNRGYADATVDIEILEAQQHDRIIIVITAEKGPCYRIGEVTWEGNTLFDDADIAQRLLIHEDSPYSPMAINDTARSISNLYGKCGYIEAFVNFEPRLVRGECIYNVNFTIDEGEQYRVGLIKVFGNCSTESSVIYHETLLIPGEIFDVNKLRKTEERLINIGYFKNVNVYAVRSEGPCLLPGNYRDVYIEVEETNTGHFGAFAGFSTVENIFGGINITERNFNYKGLPSLWSDGYRALRGGGEYAHMTFTLGRKSQSYVFSWTKPYFMDTPWIVGFDIEKSDARYISDDYDIRAAGITVHGTYHYNAFVKTGWHYRLRNTSVRVGGDASPSMRREAENAGIISAAGCSVYYDSTDHPLNPTCGFKSRLEGEVAGLGGRYRFLSSAYLNSYYYPLTQNGVFKARADFRFITPFAGTTPDELPLDERLFLGGDYDVRGYRPYRLGPKFAGEDDPRGGTSMQLYSLEYSHCIFSRLGGFVFADAGALDLKEWAFPRLNYSVGAGFRLEVFANGPPLTIGMGFPLNPESSTDVKRFFMTVGGRF